MTGARCARYHPTLRLTGNRSGMDSCHIKSPYLRAADRGVIRGTTLHYTFNFRSVTRTHAFPYSFQKRSSRVIYLDPRMRRLAPSAGSLSSWTGILLALDHRIYTLNVGCANSYFLRCQNSQVSLLMSRVHLPPADGSLCVRTTSFYLFLVFHLSLYQYIIGNSATLSILILCFF